MEKNIIKVELDDYMVDIEDVNGTYHQTEGYRIVCGYKFPSGCKNTVVISELTVDNLRELKEKIEKIIAEKNK